MKNLSPTDAAALEAVETREWLESLDYVLEQGDKARTVRLLEALRARARASAGVRVPFAATTPYINTIATSEQVPMPGDRVARAPHQEPRPLERAGDGRARQPRIGRHRRPHLDLPVGGDALRGRVQPLLPRQGQRRRRRRHLLPGPRLARASTPARSSKGGSPRSTCRTSATSCAARRGCRRIRIRG